MKTKLTISLILALMLISYISSAQEKRYIETIVSDTVMLKPVMIKYQISSGEQTFSYDFDIPQSAGETAVATSLDDVGLALKKEKFTCDLNAENNYTITKGVQNKPSITVLVKSKAELDRLIKLLEIYKGISGKISSVDYESPSPYYDVMFKKLYDKALAEANTMARISGSAVDKMISATELADQAGGYMDWIMELSKNTQYDLFGMNTGLSKVYSRKFSFRFELK